jgi:phosphoribosyl 1,2-cyclic phosphate phosphodiesterase
MKQQAHEAVYTLRFLGTGASCGVPSFYCGCKACQEALLNPAARRGCAGLLISGTQNTLVDASPDLRMQLSLAGARTIHQALLTHEHFDHIGGIPQLEYYVRLQSRQPFPLYAGSHTLAAIAEQFAFMADTLEPYPIEAWQSLVFDGVRYTALPAAHGMQTFGYIIERDDALSGALHGASHDGPLGAPNDVPNGEPDDGSPAFMPNDSRHRRIAYFPDTGPLAPEVLERLRNIDTLIIDATFNGKNWMPASHHTIDEAIALAQSLEVRKTFLTHLTMHYDEPITTRELQELLAPYRGAILAANDGLELTF